MMKELKLQTIHNHFYFLTAVMEDTLNDPAVKIRYDGSAWLRWPYLVNDQSMTNLDYFSLMYPMCGLDTKH